MKTDRRKYAELTEGYYTGDDPDDAADYIVIYKKHDGRVNDADQQTDC